MIQLSTIHPRTTITALARPPLGEGRSPHVVIVENGASAGGADEAGLIRRISGHSFARLMLSKMLLKAWHSGTMMIDHDQPPITNRV